MPKDLSSNQLKSIGSGEYTSSYLVPRIQSKVQAKTVSKLESQVGKGMYQQLDFTAIAQKIHQAITGIGTDEEAVYDALRLLKRDAKNISALKARYHTLFKIHLVNDLSEDFSGGELEEVMSFLKPYDPGESLQTTEKDNTVPYQDLKEQVVEHAGSKVADVTHIPERVNVPTSVKTSLKNIGTAFKYTGEFMNLVSLAQIALGKEELYKGLDIIGPFSMISEGKFEEIDQVHIKACLQQGFEATKQMTENSKTFPGRIIYASQEEIVKLHQKQITSASQFAEPFNSSLDYALLITKGKDFAVYGGFYIKK